MKSIQKLAPGVDGVYIHTDRFKTTRVSVNFFLPLSADTLSANTILPSMLTTSCKAYPDFRSLHKKLDSLYGAGVGGAAGKVGDAQMLTITVTYLDDAYAGEAIGKDCADLLTDMIFSPNLDENGNFKEADIVREKRLLVESIMGELNNKRAYAISKAETALCKEDVYGLPAQGTVEGAQALTAADIHAAWQRALNDAYIRISVVGKEAPDAIFDVFRSRFAELGRREVTVAGSKAIAPVETPERVVEPMDVAQGKLVMAFTTGQTGSMIDLAPFSVMCDLFGGGPYSLLFANVREKLSLCYYCAARSNRFKGTLLVDSGVEQQNAAAAEKEILVQLDRVQKGDFADSDLQAAILGRSDRIRTMFDSQRETDSFYMSQIFDENTCTMEGLLEKIGSVTREQVMEAAKDIQLSLVYMLTPKEGGENE